MSNDTPGIEFHGVRIPIQRSTDEHIMVPLRAMSDAMGLDANAMRKLVERSSWAEGMTAVMDVMLPGQPRPYPNYMVSHRVVPMWIANITASRIKNPEIRERVIMWQREFTDVLARYVYGGEDQAAERVPVTLTWDGAAAQLRQKYGIRVNASQLMARLRSASVLKVNGGPLAKYVDLFWHARTHWEVHEHALPFLAYKVVGLERELAQFGHIQMRLEAEGFGLNALEAQLGRRHQEGTTS